jgi:hypothetical protein
MTEPGAAGFAGIPRVAVYIDFDNIVISRYDQVHGRGAFQRDRARASSARPRRRLDGDAEAAERLRQARWTSAPSSTSRPRSARWCSPARTPTGRPRSTPPTARSSSARAVDLVQLFPAAAYAKNGADIRLAVDAVEDMFRLPDLTHVVIVAGDSDYIALAQRCRVSEVRRRASASRARPARRSRPRATSS